MGKEKSNAMIKRLLIAGVTFVLLWAALLHAQVPVVLVLGDSLSAGFGIDVQQGWVNLLQKRLEREGYRYRIVNASISGDTTAGGLARLPRLMKIHQPAIVIVELGGNDGLRGLPLTEIQSNLSATIEIVQKQGAQVLLLGMRLPPNYGPDYTGRFYALYEELGERYQIARMPFFLQDVAGGELMQADGIHPRAEAQTLILNNIWPYLKPALRRG
jgi:acyl-CoA thioesterase I